MGCFVNFVTGSDNDYSDQPTSLELSFRHLYNDESLDTWTVHSVNTLNFFISSEIDQVQWNTGYLRFAGKLHSLLNCFLFLLMTTSFNDTMMAIHRSGFARSNNAMFLINDDLTGDSENLMEFKKFHTSILTSGLNISKNELAFHAGIVFFNEDTKYALSFCYYCPPQLGKFHMTEWDLSRSVWTTFETLQSIDIMLNHVTGYHQVRAMIYTFNINNTREDMTELFNMSSSRERYLERAKTPTVNAPFEFPYIMGLGNITTWEARGTDEISSNEDSQLDDRFHNINVAWGESLMLRIHNSVLHNRANFLLLVEQHHLEAFYCLPLATVTKVNWDIYLHIFDLSTITAILASLAAYGCLQNDSKLVSALDLASLIVGIQCCLHHPKKMLAVYLICALFIACSVQGKVPSKFVTIDDIPQTTIDLVKQNYKAVAFEFIYEAIAKYKPMLVQSGILTMLSPFRQIWGKVSPDIALDNIHPLPYPVLIDPKRLLPIMLEHRLIRLGERPMDPLSGVLHMVQGTTKGVILQDSYWCRATTPDDFTQAWNVGHSFRMWNILAARGFRLFRFYIEAGFRIRENGFKLSYLLAQRKVSWDIVGKETKPSRITLKESPVGFALLVVATLNAMGFILFLLTLCHKHKNEIRGKLENKIAKVAVTLCDTICGNHCKWLTSGFKTHSLST